MVDGILQLRMVVDTHTQTVAPASQGCRPSELRDGSAAAYVSWSGHVSVTPERHAGLSPDQPQYGRISAPRLLWAFTRASQVVFQQMHRFCAIVLSSKAACSSRWPAVHRYLSSLTLMLLEK